MTNKEKEIIKEDIRDLQNLVFIYLKDGEHNKVCECEKEIERLKKTIERRQNQ